MQGDYNSAKTRSIVLSFEKCNQEGRERLCKSESEILKWLRQKYILTYANQRRFVIENFTADKIIEESRTNWIPINSQLREEVVFKLFITDLFLQDDRLNTFSLGSVDAQRVFKFVEQKSRPYEFDDDVHISVTFEIELDLAII